MKVDCSSWRPMLPSRTYYLSAGVLALAAMAAMPAVSFAAEPALASSWVTEQTARARVIAGGVRDVGGQPRTYAGVEIVLDEGWKTYWRNPGSSGVPPRIDWEGSENLASAEVLFPAPVRFKDKDGDTIGYKHKVIFPIAVTPKDPSRPIKLKLSAEFGICREVCIPVQPAFSLDLPADAVTRAPGDGLAAAVAKVPRRGASGTNVPSVKDIKIDLTAPKPHIVIAASFPGDPDGGDVFLEAPEGIWIPLAKSSGITPDGLHRFEVDLTDGADLSDLKSRTILMTLVSKTGQVETAFKLE